MSSLRNFHQHGSGHSYSTDSLNEVCSSTASMSVSRHCGDSPTVVSFSSSTAHSTSNGSEQFDDAEETSPAQPVKPQRAPASYNPLDALALACAVEDNKTEKTTAPPQVPGAYDGDISQNDVLCGRGGLTNHHPGNVCFRRLVRMKQEAYLMATKRDKAGVAKEIVDCIRNLNPSGRFLKKDPRNVGQWIDIGDRKAREKTSQALREGAPELREELHSPEGTTQASPSLGMMSAKQARQPQRMVPDPYVDANKVNMINERAVQYAMQQQQQQQQLQQRQHMMYTPQKPLSGGARVVSSDSNYGGVRPLFHSMSQGSGPHLIVDDQSTYYATQEQDPAPPASYRHPQPMDMEDKGMKRKSSEPNKRGGPRLKLFKQRLAREDDGAC